MLKYLLLTFCLYSSGSGIVHELRLYSGLNQTGELYTITEKQPDLTSLRPVLETVQSYCSVGFWRYYKEIDYENYAGVLPTECWNYNPFSNVYSLLFNGPKDTSVKALTILKGTYNQYDNNSLGGEEVVNLEAEIADFGFVGRYMLSTGNPVSWQLFTEPNFVGSSLCFGPNEPNQDYHWFTPGLNRPFRYAGGWKLSVF